MRRTSWMILRQWLLVVLATAISAALASAETIEFDICDDSTVASSRSTPSEDFTAIDDGSVVRHERTGLEWKRCAQGKEWDDGRCAGEAKQLTWQEALDRADETDMEEWRLPNVKELRSIAERCNREPAINRSVFPDTEPENFWSASPVFDLTGHAWVVQFDGGGTLRVGHNWEESRVRLVRSKE